VVFIWRSGGRRRGWGPGPGWGGGYGPGWGRGYGGPPPGWGYRRGYGGGGGSCLRDLLFLDAGCCLAESLGCGNSLLLVAPRTIRHLHHDTHAQRGGGAAARLVAAIRVYQREVSPRRPPVCRFTPSCSEYAAQAVEKHGARRGGWLAVRRLLRCRPGAAGGRDPIPA